MDRLLPTDELTVLREVIAQDFALPPQERKKREPERFDEILEMLIIAYMFGNEAGNGMLGTDQPISEDRMNDAVFREIAGQNWEQRVREYYGSDGGTVDDVMRVIETDANRIYNDGILNVGDEYVSSHPEESGTVSKTWMTMADDRVRDTHDYLEGMTVPFRSRFYTYDGDSARYPGDFALAQNNVNCRCRIVLNNGRRSI